MVIFMGWMDIMESCLPLRPPHRHCSYWVHHLPRHLVAHRKQCPQDRDFRRDLLVSLGFVRFPNSPMVGLKMVRDLHELSFVRNGEFG